jgi:hypothetical protein
MQNNQRILVLEETGCKPTPGEIEDYAQFLGIDLEHERDLIWLAEEGLNVTLPPAWKACQAEQDEHIFFFNFETGASVWEHPCDDHYRERVEELRAARVTVPITLSANRAAEMLDIVGYNLAGVEIAKVVIAATESFATMEDLFLEQLSLPQGSVPYFILKDSTLVGYSYRAKSLSEIFASSIS